MKIAGVDEAGRGPLVGSVVAAAVILDPNNPIEGLNDSKKLTEKKREKLFVEIQEKALAWAIAEASAAEIDEHEYFASLIAGDASCGRSTCQFSQSMYWSMAIKFLKVWRCAVMQSLVGMHCMLRFQQPVFWLK